MAGGEHEAEEVVTDLLVDRCVWIEAFLSPLEIASELFMLALEWLKRAPFDAGTYEIRQVFEFEGI